MELQCFLGSSREERRVALFEAFGGGADVTAPTLLSATIDEAGTTLTLVFSESVTGVLAADYALSSGALSAPAGSGDTWTFTITPAITSAEVVTLDYTGTSTEDAAGNNLAAIAAFAVTNNSTQSSGPTLIFTEPFTYGNGNIGAVSSAVWVVAEGVIDIDTNRVKGNSGSAYSLAFHTTALNANQRVELSISAANNIGFIGPAARVQSSGVNGYYVITNGTELDLDQVSGGVHTTLIFDAAANIGTGHKIAIEVSGVGAAARIKVQVDTGGGWVDKWTDINPGADIDGGFAGVAAYTNSATFGDDLKGYNL